MLKESSLGIWVSMWQYCTNTNLTNLNFYSSTGWKNHFNNINLCFSFLKSVKGIQFKMNSNEHIWNMEVVLGIGVHQTEEVGNSCVKYMTDVFILNVTHSDGWSYGHEGLYWPGQCLCLCTAEWWPPAVWQHDILRLHPHLWSAPATGQRSKKFVNSSRLSSSAGETGSLFIFSVTVQQLKEIIIWPFCTCCRWPLSALGWTRACPYPR